MQDIQKVKQLYIRELKQYQNKLNYTNELHRLRGILSQNDTRFPIGTKERLQERVHNLKNLLNIETHKEKPKYDKETFEDKYYDEIKH